MSQDDEESIDLNVDDIEDIDDLTDDVDTELDLDLICDGCGCKYSSEDFDEGDDCPGCGGELQPKKNSP